MRVLLALLCLTLLGLVGCGSVGDPLPPLLDIPEPPLASAVQRGDQLLVSWPAPLKTTEGVAPRPGRLGPILVYRLVLDYLKAAATSAEFQQAREIARLEPGKTRYEEPVDSAWFNHTVAYAVKMTNLRGESAGFSNLAATPVLAVGRAPSFRCDWIETAVQLRWDAPAGALFRIYRDGAPLGEAQGSSFDDKTFQFDKTYVYTIRALARRGDFSVESADSSPVTVTPLDAFPPKAPLGVSAIGAEGAVDISWSPSAEPDLAGYNVYRGATRLNDKLIVNTVFRDLAPGPSPRYVVKAVDTHNNESVASTEVAP